MSKFTEAFEAGISAGKKANENRIEIDSIFQELSEDIASISDGKLSISRETRTRKEKVFRRLSRLETALGIHGPSPYYEEEISYDAIVLHSDKGTKEIAEFEISEAGYPISFEWSDREESCFDKKALTRTLREILSDATTGKAVLELLPEAR